MTYEVQIHQAQTAILRELLFTPQANFADLQKPTSLDGDHFKFHIGRLVDLGYVQKISRGRYSLTISGKEYANKLDTDTNSIERQPKLSVLLIIKREAPGSAPEFLFQQRLKNPYFGFWGLVTGKVRWGESLGEAAARELEEETGLTANFDFDLLFRKRDYTAESNKLLEDKLFAVMKTNAYSGELIENYEGGLNRWMTIDQFKSQATRFTSISEVFEENRGPGKPYLEKDYFYKSNEY